VVVSVLKFIQISTNVINKGATSLKATFIYYKLKQLPILKNDHPLLRFVNPWKNPVLSEKHGVSL